MNELITILLNSNEGYTIKDHTIYVPYDYYDRMSHAEYDALFSLVYVHGFQYQLKANSI